MKEIFRRIIGILLKEEKKETKKRNQRIIRWQQINVKESFQQFLSFLSFSYRIGFIFFSFILTPMKGLPTVDSWKHVYGIPVIFLQS